MNNWGQSYLFEPEIEVFFTKSFFRNQHAFALKDYGTMFSTQNFHVICGIGQKQTNIFLLRVRIPHNTLVQFEICILESVLRCNTDTSISLSRHEEDDGNQYDETYDELYFMSNRVRTTIQIFFWEVATLPCFLPK